MSKLYVTFSTKNSDIGKLKLVVQLIDLPELLDMRFHVKFGWLFFVFLFFFVFVFDKIIKKYIICLNLEQTKLIRFFYSIFKREPRQMLDSMK